MDNLNPFHLAFPVDDLAAARRFLSVSLLGSEINAGFSRILTPPIECSIFVLYEHS
jgi:extradiol dioxygenase family protein